MAYLELGASPRPNINDPKSLKTLQTTFALEITLTLLTGAPGALLCGVFAQFGVFRRSIRQRILYACLLIMIWVAVFLYLAHDPLNIIEWLLD